MSSLDKFTRPDNISVTELAENCGYQSEPAFRKAFKKQFGVGPGIARREAKAKLWAIDSPAS